MADITFPGGSVTVADEEEQAPRPPVRPLCSVCKAEPSRYCCPGCQTRSCSLACSKKHKEDSGCNGQQDKLKFVPITEFDDRTLLSDFRVLENVKRTGDNARRHRPPAPKPQLPPLLSSLVHQARLRGVRLLIMPPGMHKRKINSTRFESRSRKLHWRIHWLFVQSPPTAVSSALADATVMADSESTPEGPALTDKLQTDNDDSAAGITVTPEGVCVADGRVSDDAMLKDLLAAHLQYAPGKAAKQFVLRDFADAGLDNMVVLYKKEQTPANQPGYYLIDINQSIASALQRKLVIEFPTFIVTHRNKLHLYPVVPDEAPQPQQNCQYRHQPSATELPAQVHQQHGAQRGNTLQAANAVASRPGIPVPRPPTAPYPYATTTAAVAPPATHASISAHESAARAPQAAQANMPPAVATHAQQQHQAAFMKVTRAAHVSAPPMPSVHTSSAPHSAGHHAPWPPSVPHPGNSKQSAPTPPTFPMPSADSTNTEVNRDVKRQKVQQSLATGTAVMASLVDARGMLVKMNKPNGNIAAADANEIDLGMHEEVPGPSQATGSTAAVAGCIVTGTSAVAAGTHDIDLSHQANSTANVTSTEDRAEVRAVGADANEICLDAWVT